MNLKKSAFFVRKFKSMIRTKCGKINIKNLSEIVDIYIKKYYIENCHIPLIFGV